MEYKQMMNENIMIGTAILSTYADKKKMEKSYNQSKSAFSKVKKLLVYIRETIQAFDALLLYF